MREKNQNVSLKIFHHDFNLKRFLLFTAQLNLFSQIRPLHFEFFVRFKVYSLVVVVALNSSTDTELGFSRLLLLNAFIFSVGFMLNSVFTWNLSLD